MQISMVGLPVRDREQAGSGLMIFPLVVCF